MLSMFCLVTMVIPAIALWAYLPDRRLRDWSIREVGVSLLLKFMQITFLITFSFSGFPGVERERSRGFRTIIQRLH